MPLIKLMRRLIPESIGGHHRNIYSMAVIWSRIPPEFRPPLSEFLLKSLRDLRSGEIELNRAPLWNWIRKHKPDKILEIGFGGGANARKMIDLAGKCTYFCFDNLSAADMESYEELRRMSNTKFCIGDTMETLPKVIKSLPKMDIIFIDGAHDYEHAKNDWKHCERLMHSSTACFFHDYEGIGVKKVVDGIGEGFDVEVLAPPIPPIFALVRRM